jgi:hypothetical protein
MESKEALKKLFFDNNDLHVDIVLNDRNVCEIYNIIKDDLERLETIKKHLEVNGLSITCFISGNPNNELDYEPRFDELKEWLGNEN